jgi:F-box/leucine-rich repeat protein 2/20
MLSSCKSITDVSIEYLTRYCPGIVKLCLSECNLLTDAAISHIANKCHLLIHLDISKCLLVNSVEELQRGCPELQVLLFSDCANINEHSLKTIVSLPYLERLNAIGCRKLSDSVLFQLANTAPSMRYLHLGLNKITQDSINTLKKKRRDICIHVLQKA